jgi:hypothetical protein
MSIRKYNKLYVNKDREEGSDNILLGYQSTTRELVLKKDTETIFHVPYNTELTKLTESFLVQDGATAGLFPAASDRIFKNLKDYGNSTSNGTPSEVADGSWFCSWLYKDELGNTKWLDRYYNPGKLTLALDTLTQVPVYENNDPIFRDEPSKMTFEPGVQYKYFHVGEKTAKELVTSFAGISGERLKLNIEAWGTNSPDTSLSSKQVEIVTKETFNILYPTDTETDRISASSINFNGTQDIKVSVKWDPSYCLSNEYSLAFWAYSNDWKQSQTTQLAGNFSSSGGVGVFIDTLSSYPFFAIIETGYGHLLHVNEQNVSFLDKSLQPTITLTATPQLIALDTDNNVIVGYTDNSRKISKFDNTGKLLAAATLPNQLVDIPLQIICGQNDSVIVITNKAIYTYSSNLTLLTTTTTNNTLSTIASYTYNKQTGTANLQLTDNVYDSKYIEDHHWYLSIDDGNLYKKDPARTSPELYAAFEETATAFGIDPYERLWVLHGTNNISVFDSTLDALSDPLFTFTAGKNVLHDQKNISFVCVYDRATNIREWKCIIYYADRAEFNLDPQIYICNMKGVLLKIIDMYSLFNVPQYLTLKQVQSKFEFFSKGDFTGYEHRRVFNNTLPYKNETQIIIKASLKDKTKANLAYTQFKAYASIGNWDNKNWKHIVLTLQNRTFNLFVDGKLLTTLSYSGQYELNYEMQPTFFVGSPGGSQNNFNEEIKCPSAIFNGLFEDVKIYDYALDPKKLDIFQKKAYEAQDIYWSYPTPSIQYIEKIERMFKNKIPGAKATYYNIKLTGTHIVDPETRSIIENNIREVVSEIQPTYANFLKVHWID